MEKTPIDPGMIRLASGLLVPDGTKAYFGPGQPLPPTAPQDQRWSVAGRSQDYSFAANTQNQPKAGEGVTFPQLRALADGLDILRLVIQTRKYQMAALEWAVVPRDPEAKVDDRCKEIEEFFRKPDGEHTWNEWLQMLLEDRFVLDAATIYPWMRNNGKPYRFEVMDGTQISRVLDARGRTPAAPSPAYRHLIKGVPAIYYTSDELIYRPANLRANSIYGYSEVQQILVTVNAAIRRQISQLERFTKGSVPDMLFATPEDWNMSQIQEFNDWFQDRLSGNTGAQRKAQFVPNGIKPIDTKETVLKDEYDEWLARVVCYAFSVSPQAFIKQLNRSTSETAQDMAKEEGLFPVMNWMRDLMDSIVEKYFGYADLCFKWKLSDELSLKERAEVTDKQLKNGTKTIDEVRAANGDKPLGINFPMVLTASGYVAVPKTEEEAKPKPAPQIAMQADPKEDSEDSAVPDGKDGQDGPGKDGTPGDAPKAKEDKAKKGMFTGLLRKMGANDPALEEALIKAMFVEKFKKLAASIEAQLDDGMTVNDIQLEFGDLAEKLYRAIVEEVKAGISTGEAAMAQAGIESFATAAAVTDGKAWAMDRVADLIGRRKNDDGKWVDNPKPGMAISDSTREMIRGDIAQGLEEGKSNADIAKGLKESYAFSDKRAELIARTETGEAQTRGAIEAYKANGVSAMVFVAAPDCCSDCQEDDGRTVPIAEADDESLPHPQCRCSWQPYFDDESNG